SSKSPESKSPVLPDNNSLKQEPASINLHDARDARKVLVWGEAEDHGRFDLTMQASLKSESPNVEIDSDGFIHPKQKGEATIAVSAAGKEGTLKVTVESDEMPEVRFVREIGPIL